MCCVLVCLHASGRNPILNDFDSDWMRVHIPIQNGFVERLVLYKTIENSNMKINMKILLSNVKIFIVVRTQYQKVKSEKKNIIS